MEGGLDLVSGGTDNHLMLVDLRPAHLTGKEMEHRLDEVYITVNKNAIPNDPEKPFVTSGIRVGTPAVTSRGFTEEDMNSEIARHLPGRSGRLRLQGGRPARPGEGAHRPLSPLSERLIPRPNFSGFLSTEVFDKLRSGGPCGPPEYRLSKKPKGFSDSLQKCRYFSAAARWKSPRCAR